MGLDARSMKLRGAHSACERTSHDTYAMTLPWSYREMKDRVRE